MELGKGRDDGHSGWSNCEVNASDCQSILVKVSAGETAAQVKVSATEVKVSAVKVIPPKSSPQGQ